MQYFKSSHVKGDFYVEVDEQIYIVQNETRELYYQYDS